MSDCAGCAVEMMTRRDSDSYPSRVTRSVWVPNGSDRSVSGVDANILAIEQDARACRGRTHEQAPADDRCALRASGNAGRARSAGRAARSAPARGRASGGAGDGSWRRDRGAGDAFEDGGAAEAVVAAARPEQRRWRVPALGSAGDPPVAGSAA